MKYKKMIKSKNAKIDFKNKKTIPQDIPIIWVNV